MNPYIGPLCALLSSLTWAIGSAGYSRLSRAHSAFAVNFGRALVALPIFFLTTFFVSGGLSAGFQDYSVLSVSHVGWFGLSMIASYGLGDVLFLWSTRSLGVPGALAISSAYPLWTSLAGYFFRGEAMQAMQVVGLLLTIIGIVVVILNGPAHEGGGVSGPSRPKGIALAFVTSLMWATNSYAVAQGGVGVSSSVGNTVRMLWALGLSFGFSRVFLPRTSIFLPVRAFRQNLWLFALEAFGGSYLFMYGLSHSPLAIGSTLASLAPVISVPIAWVLRLEKFSLFRTLGVLSVVFGIALLVGGF